MRHVELRNAHDDTGNAHDRGRCALVEAPANLPADSWQLWYTFAPTLQAAGTLHAGNVRAYQTFISLAVAFVCLSRHGLYVAPTFRAVLLQHAACFGLTAADVDALALAHGCAKGIM